jgi:DNA gyrase subunit B
MLANEEIRILISALGAGIGDDYDISKIRYHRIIIMTDADVDGSHIRTLLLTLFYRHMPEVIERAKSEVMVQQTKKKLTDKKLGLLFEKIYLYHDLVQRIENKGYSRPLLNVLLENGIRSKANLAEKEKVTDLRKKLEKNGFEVEEVYWDEEHNVYGLEVQRSNGGKDRRIKIHWNLIASVEYRNLVQIYQEIREIAPPPYLMIENGKEVVIDQEEALLHSLNQLGKEGLSIQRYKGLGEMNPEQLWQTTMNPETRTLLKVRVEDAVEADETFSILMGDEVDQRRRFIEENALIVQNLDI